MHAVFIYPPVWFNFPLYLFVYSHHCILKVCIFFRESSKPLNLLFNSIWGYRSRFTVLPSPCCLQPSGPFLSTCSLCGRCGREGTMEKRKCLKNREFLGSCRHKVAALTYVLITFTTFCSRPFYVFMNTMNRFNNLFYTIFSS